MFPLAFLFLSCIAYTILGLLVLALLPVFRLTFANLLLFVTGAIPGGFLFLFLYGLLLGESMSDTAFFGILPVLLAGGLSGGSLAVWLKMRFAKPNT